MAAAGNEQGRTTVTPERWQAVKEVLASALERAPGERRAYLDQACTEPALRREVESLIAAQEEGDSTFLERPIVESHEMLNNGMKLGPYEVLARIGMGGMGVVYRARDGRLERDVAIKVLPSAWLADEAAHKRFHKEALALAKLNHPNIAALHDVGDQGGMHYLVMECVPGHSLAEEVRSRPLPEKEALGLAGQIAAALEEAHEQGILHRDLKPGNIMVTPKGQVKVLDFGLAKMMLRPSDATATETLTQTQTLAGTLPYMAPEQLRGEPADGRTDLHALGAVLFEMVTGKRVYQGDSGPQLTEAILHQPPVAPRALNARVSPELERIILKCLEKEPENRYQSAKEVGVDLRRLSAPSAVTAAATARPAPRRRLLLALAAVLLVATGGAVGGYLYLHRAPKLTEKDSIVVADFANSTGDPVFDGTLRQGLSVQLEQTPFLQLVSNDRVRQTLRLMEKPPDTPLQRDVAREVCERVNAKAEIEGSIAALDNQYVLGLNAVNCHTGETLAQEQVTADGKTKVLAALSGAASELRSKLGESSASLEEFDAPLEQVTTPSLEALQAWTLGTQALLKGAFPTAIAFYQRAVDIDPNFAMAYTNLGLTQRFVGEYGRAIENTEKGYALRDRASEREKLATSANYNVDVTGDMDKAAQVCEQWAKIFPRDSAAFIGLNASSLFAGRQDEMLSAAREMLRLDPTAYAYQSVSGSYVVLGRFDEARATIQQAEASHVDGLQYRGWPYYVMAFMQNDPAGMAKWSARLRPSLADETLSYTAAYGGHLSRARDLAQHATATLNQQGAPELMASYQVNAALLEALFGNFTEAQTGLRDAGNFLTNQDLEGEAAIAWGLSGDAVQTQKLADDLHKRFPHATYVRFGTLPAIRAILAIRRGNAQEAIENLRAISSRELILPVDETIPAMAPVYVSGEVYLAAHQGAEAAAEFQKILDHPGFVGNAPIGALAHLGLGRAYELMGDTAKAKAAYQDFLALWKDADPDIPILKQAKAEYAKLK
jgi:tetratricopeptide (TPR) repeat protein